MFFNSTKMNIQFMKVFQESTKRGAYSHLCESIHILRKTFTTISELTIRTWYISMSVIDITRKKNTSVYFTPIRTHLFAIFTTCIEIGYLIGTKYIVHVLCELCF